MCAVASYSAPAAITHGPRSPKGATTIKRVETAMEKGNAHCLPELIELMQAICIRGSDIQVGDLCELVEKHVGVMSKVITSATTLGYNPTRMEITTLNHAVQVIGFDRIRSLVTTLLLVQHAKDADGAREQKEAAISAVCSGLIAQTVSRERKLVDPEEAFVAASLRQLGRLLMSTYLKDEYKKVMHLTATTKVSEKQNFQEVFGLTPVELTRAILVKAKFPQALLDTLHEPENAPKKPKKRGEVERPSLMDVSVFSERLTGLTMNRNLVKEVFPQRARSLCANYPEEMDYAESEMAEMLGAVGESLGSFTESMGFGLVASESVQMCRHRQGKADMPSYSTPPIPVATGTEVPPAAVEMPVPAPAPEPEVSTASTPPVAAEPLEKIQVEIGISVWKDGLVTLSSYLHDPSISTADLLALAADIIRDGFGAPECMLLALDSDNHNFSTRHGRGRVFDKMKGRVSMKKGERTALGVSVMRKEHVLIHDTTDPKTAPYLPEWGTLACGWGAFVAVPFHDTQNTFALTLVAWPRPCQLVLTPEQTKLLRSIISMVAAARKAAA